MYNVRKSADESVLGQIFGDNLLSDAQKNAKLREFRETPSSDMKRSSSAPDVGSYNPRNLNWKYVFTYSFACLVN